VLRTSVSAVTFVSTYDRTTDNHISATSSSKSTDYHKQASKYLQLHQLDVVQSLLSVSPTSQTVLHYF